VVWKVLDDFSCSAHRRTGRPAGLLETF
jgi:hypothetical protein